MQKKKICFYTGTLKQGGVERDISILSNLLCEKGFEVYIVTVFSPEIFFKFNASIKIIDISGKIKDRSIHSLLILKKEILRLQKEYNFNYIIGNMTGLNCLLIHTLKKQNCKTVVRIASDPKSWSFKKRFLSSIYYKKADCVIGQTEYQISCFKRRLNNTFVIPNICDYDFSFTPDNLFKNDQICYIGRLNVEVKRIDVLIEGFCKFAEKNNRFCLSLIGEFANENDKKIILDKIGKLGLEQKVLIHKPVPNIQDELSKSCCFLFASPHEGMPNAILEAQLSGLPVITSNFNGVNEIIKDNVDGMIYQFGDVDEISAKLNELLTNFEMYKEISSNGISNKNRYSTKTVMEQWAKVLNY